MPRPNLLLIQPSVLPPVFEKVVEAKQLLASGAAKTASEAARMSGISRSAFYKYRDCVFAYNPAEDGRIITIHTVLRVLSTLIGRLAENGANILTVNQNIPIDGAASVSLSIRTNLLRSNLEELIDALRTIDGVVSLEQILGE